jgi:hypothetical protein
VLNAFTSREPLKRAELAAPPPTPSGSEASPPETKGLVASMSTLPLTSIAAATSSRAAQGTARSTASPCAAASDGAPDLVPISAASDSSSVGLRLKLRNTSWPRFDHCRARFSPMFPAPMIPTFTTSRRCRLGGRHPR